MRVYRLARTAAAIWGCTLLALVALPRAQCQQLRLPPVTRYRMPNGVSVALAAYRRAPTLSVRLLFRGGTAQDLHDRPGTADLMATLLRKGTAHRSAVQIADEIETLGARLSTGASPDSVSVSLDCLARDADAALTILADVVRNPTFPDEEVTRQKDLERSALQSLREDAGALAARASTVEAYAGHPYGSLATLASLGRIERGDLMGAYRAQVRPELCTAVVVGDIAIPAMRERLTRLFGDWSPGGGSALEPVPAPAAVPIRMVIIDKPDSTQTHIRLVRRGIRAGDPAEMAARLAETILGGGFTSRLTEEIRVNRSLTYGIGCGFGKLARGGTFSISTFTRVETTRAMLSALDTELQKAAGKLTTAECTRAKGYLAGQFAIGAQSPEALADLLAEMALHGRPADYLQTYLQRLKAVSLAEVNGVAKRFFGPGAFATILVGPASRVRPQIASRGRAVERKAEEIVR